LPLRFDEENVIPSSFSFHLALVVYRKGNREHHMQRIEIRRRHQETRWTLIGAIGLFLGWLGTIAVAAGIFAAMYFIFFT